MSQAEEFVLALSCADRPGIVHAVSGFLVAQHCNIVSSQQFEDRDSGMFFMRVQASALNGLDVEALRAAFTPVAEAHAMDWSLTTSEARARVLIMVSKFGHCLNDLLFRWRSGSLPVDIVGVVSNHRDFEDLVGTYSIPFHYIPVTAETKADAERELIDLVDAESVDLVVLARYMQVLSDDLCKSLEGKVINIHHSFLPSFKGAKPYHQAHQRGVKLIGATAHYVTGDLDEGPIIEQEVQRVGHDLSPERLAAVGRDTECAALARAVGWHVDHRVFMSGRRTVVFR